MNTDSALQPEELFPRSAGILLHPTSFPSPFGIGDLGAEAYAFIDFLEKAKQRLWQILPLTPTGFGDSPYKSDSAFAGQPLLIDLRQLVEWQLLTPEDLVGAPNAQGQMVDYEEVKEWKNYRFRKAYNTFNEQPLEDLHSEYNTFYEENEDWLDIYALFLAIRQYHDGAPWYQWDERYIHPIDEVRRSVSMALEPEKNYHKFVQFLFFKQWYSLKKYANERGVLIIGDLPIFVHLDSADVWENQHLFQLDTEGRPTHVAGVPPDYFSSTGQLWGNPLYDWVANKKENYRWWIRRVEHQIKMQDYVRIDHFRGFESYWSVPRDSETAIDGAWEKGPGTDLFDAIEEALGNTLPIIAEDLGLITPEVEQLRDFLFFPGMKILQFAFDGDYESTFLPHRYTTTNCICYTGTHDNNTSLGWYLETSEANRDKVRRYMNTSGEAIHMDFIRTCLGTIANFAIYPLQDVLGLDGSHRMNTPGTIGGNWHWRYQSHDLTDDLAAHLAALIKLFGRL